MRTINIQICERSGLARTAEPVKFSIPFAQGELSHPHHLTLSLAAKPIFAQYQVLTYWPDGSIRWLQISCILSVAANFSGCLTLTVHAEPQAIPDVRSRVEKTSAGWLLQRDFTQYSVNTQTLCTKIRQDEQCWDLSFEFAYQDGQTTVFLAEQNTEHWVSGPVFDELLVSGFLGATAPTLRISLLLRFWHQAGIIEVEARLHNPQRAMHPGGLWDLGDPGSIQFHAFSALLKSHQSGKAALKPSPEREWLDVSESDELQLLQASSGKANWRSANHQNAQGEVKLLYKGYKVFQNDNEIAQAEQASPVAQLNGENWKCQIAQAEFWQNFPSAISCKKDRLKLCLFPAITGQNYELQGGERKTQRFAVAVGHSTGTLHWLQQPLRCQLAVAHYHTANAFPWFGPLQDDDPVNALLTLALNGKHSFSAKRDIIDEYGWRNFGDIFADHESLYLPPEHAPYISHYNNQYDPVFGFARQFALTGDSRWFQLMDELARHVTDIDIYHTEQDRVEYNNGLFWHTDHYLPAHTATHRTYSKHNQTSSIPGQTGGGPATEHCYTTGLKYHFWLTGNPQSKAAVIQLAEWMNALHGEAPGLLNQLWAIKSRELPALLTRIKGKARSLFPLTRGTGNYITALLDAYDLSLNLRYLKQCATVIKHSIAATDNIESRNLLDVEVAWSYTILLTSIARYLQLKKLLGEFDADFHYARESFLAYCRWMVQHERLYLSAATELEFANDTWLAQDIRKAMLMFQAAELSPAEASVFLDKANCWLTAITAGLAQSKELHFSRVQIILLQNFGPHYAQEGFPAAALVAQPIPESSSYSLIPVLSRISYKLAKALLTCRFKRERNWIKTRMNN